MPQSLKDPVVWRDEHARRPLVSRGSGSEEGVSMVGHVACIRNGNELGVPGGHDKLTAAYMCEPSDGMVAPY